MTAAIQLFILVLHCPPWSQVLYIQGWIITRYNTFPALFKAGSGGSELNYLTYPLTGPGRSWIAGPAGISRLGPNSEPRGNNRSFPETRERDRVPVKKIGSRDSIFGLVNSTYSFEKTNHNQLVSNIKYLANFIKKYWTCFRYQKLADFLVCLPPSVRVLVRWPPSWKICLRIQLSFGFWGRAVKAFDNFSRKLAWLLKTIF